MKDKLIKLFNKMIDQSSVYTNWVDQLGALESANAVIIKFDSVPGNSCLVLQQRESKGSKYVLWRICFGSIHEDLTFKESETLFGRCNKRKVFLETQEANKRRQSDELLLDSLLA